MGIAERQRCGGNGFRQGHEPDLAIKGRITVGYQDIYAIFAQFC